MEVEELAKQAGLSRSTFAERFTRLIGVSPMHFSLFGGWRWRGTATARDSSDLAARSPKAFGYESEAAFFARLQERSSAAAGGLRRAG
jgi:AraC-like DNA-binding protein